MCARRSSSSQSAAPAWLKKCAHCPPTPVERRATLVIAGATGVVGGGSLLVRSSEEGVTPKRALKSRANCEGRLKPSAYVTDFTCRAEGSSSKARCSRSSRSHSLGEQRMCTVNHRCSCRGEMPSVAASPPLAKSQAGANSRNTSTAIPRALPRPFAPFDVDTPMAGCSKGAATTMYCMKVRTRLKMRLEFSAPHTKLADTAS